MLTPAMFRESIKYHQSFPSNSIYITAIHSMLMSNGDFAEYTVIQFPYQFNDLTDIQFLYPSLVMEIALMRMPMNTSNKRCRVLNALIAYWNDHSREEVIVVEFQSIQHALEIEPDITHCKRILLNTIRLHWGVTFKDKKLTTC